MLKNKLFTPLFLFLLIVFMMVAQTTGFAAEPTVNLGSTENFAVLAGTTVTNTGATTIGGSAGGDVGVSPGSAVTGFPPGVISDGTIHAGDALASQAQADLVIAYDDAAGRTVTADLTGQDLGGLTLTSGVYHFSSSAQLTGELTLDAEGDPNAAFIFQIGSTLTTASSSVVTLINGARYCRVFWQVGSSVTLGTGSDFKGHIFALTSITATTNASVQGQLLARNGAVTLDSNIITNGICAEVETPTPTPTPTATPTTAPTDSSTAPTDSSTAPTDSPTATLTDSPAPSLSNSPETNPQTGDNTADDSWISISVAVLGSIIIIAGLIMYFVRRRKAGA